MKNADIVKHFPLKKELNAQAAWLAAQIDSFETRLRSLDDILYELNHRVTHVINGVAVFIAKDSHIIALGDDCGGRRSIYYPNAHNQGKTWGVRLQGHVCGVGGDFIGASFSKAKAYKIAVDWVTKGERPNDTGRKRRDPSSSS